MDLAEVADGGRRAVRLNQQAGETDHHSRAAEGIERGQAREVRAEIEGRQSFPRKRSVKPRSISASCVSAEASRFPRSVSRMALPRSRAVSPETSTEAARPTAARQLRTAASSC